MTADEIFEEYREDFKRRKFVGGLLPAIIDFLLELRMPRDDIESFDEFLEVFSQQHLTAAGKRANTLIVERSDGSTLSIRPFYNAIERFYLSEKHRHDFPSCAPHATQAWNDYTEWLDTLVRLEEDELVDLRERAVQHVLDELPDRSFDPATLDITPPTFRLLLEGFDFKAPTGEPSGGAFQGAVFGFMRAENPHLQVEIDKVRTGSRRRERVGDIDAWDGDRLAITAEVKYRTLDVDAVPDLSSFINAVRTRRAIGLVVGLDISDDAKEAFLTEGVKPLTLEELIQIVEMWDPAKQRIAVKSMVYYADHVEKNSVLTDRLNEFLSDLDED